MRSRAYRRHKTYAKMWRRLKEDRNQHYTDLYTNPKAMARFKEQPKGPQCYCCSSPRYDKWAPLEARLTMQERKWYSR